MFSTTRDLWIPFGFSVALSVIALVTFVATGSSGAWIPAFISFLPMCFLLAAYADRSTRQQVQALEARIAQLEAEKAARNGDAPAA